MIGDDLAAVLPELRAQAESMMRDTIRVERDTGEVETDPDTLEETPVYATVYEGRGRWQRPDTVAGERVAGEVEFGINRVVVQLPIAATGILRGDRASCLSSEMDPDLVGAKATVLGVPNKSHATMRRLLCEEAS